MERVESHWSDDFKSNFRITNKTNIMRKIENIDEFRDFIETYSEDILARVRGESDGWNQKMRAINSIIKKEKIKISDDVWGDDEFEEIINKI